MDNIELFTSYLYSSNKIHTSNAKYKNLCINEENNFIKMCIHNNNSNQCDLLFKLYADCIKFKYKTKNHNI